MKWFYLLVFNFILSEAYAASCCVANTSVPNLMLMPSSWQQTMAMGNSRVIGDVDQNGQSIFRRSSNKDTVQFLRMDLAHRWATTYQSGVSFRYQNRSRSLNGTSAEDSGWSDVGLFHAWQPIKYERTFVFQNINIPTARSNYNSVEDMAVDAHGSGTYMANIGLLHIKNFKQHDLTVGGEFHHSFSRQFQTEGTQTKVSGYSGASVSMGAGYIPWRSKMRYGMMLTPRYELEKSIQVNNEIQKSKPSLVWDTVLNVSYTFNSEYALGISYLDQTVLGPARNTLLNRSLNVLVQKQWP